MQVLCAHCREPFDTEASRFNRAAKIGAPLYCGKACAGLARRRKIEPTEGQKKEAKRLYDKQRREKLGDEIRAKRMADYYANHEHYLKQHAEYRKTRMPAHVEYCRRPEYKEYKRQYDAERNESEYGEFTETWRLLQDLEKEIRSRASSYEVRVQQGYYTRNAQKRRRELWLLRSKT